MPEVSFGTKPADSALGAAQSGPSVKTPYPACQPNRLCCGDCAGPLIISGTPFRSLTMPGGELRRQVTSMVPRGKDEVHEQLCGIDLRPVPGLCGRAGVFPRLTPWAILFRPSVLAADPIRLPGWSENSTRALPPMIQRRLGDPRGFAWQRGGRYISLLRRTGRISPACRPASSRRRPAAGSAPRAYRRGAFR